MPYTLKPNKLFVKDPEGGGFLAQNVIAEQTTEEMVAEIQTEGTAIKNTIVNQLNQAISDSQTAIDTLETQKDNIVEAVASMAELGTDTSLSVAGMAADAKATGDAVNDLNSDFEIHDEVLETAFATKYEKVITLTEDKAINADGSLYNSSDTSFKHTNLIEVNPGQTYKCDFVCGTQNFNFRVMGYTSSATNETYDTSTFVKQLLFFIPTVNSTNSGTFTIDDPTIKYIRFSGRISGTHFMIDGEINCAGDFISESIYTYVDNQLNEAYTNISLWENGTFSGQNPSASTTRIRTIDYFTADDFSGLSCNNNYEFLIVAWDKVTGAYVGTWGANGTAFVTSGASSWVKQFDFKQFPDYKFKIALRNAVNTSATVAVSEAVNAVFNRPKYAPIDAEMHTHAGYTRLYSDITSDIVWQNKTITTEGISDSSTEVIAQLPSSGNVEVRMRYTTENSEFAVYQKVGDTITLMCDWTHYEFRYTGDYLPEYYVRVKTAATNNRDFVMKHCLVIYKYCDQGIDFHKKTNMFGKKVAVFGDSIVQGKIRKNQATDVNSVTCKPWSSLIAEVNGDFNPHNFGIGGATVANAGTTTYPDWKSLYTLRNVITGFDIVFVCAGVNDYGAGIAEADFRTAYSAVLDALIANNTTVVVATLCARSTNSANSAGLKPSDYADIEKEIGTAKNLKVIDLYSLTNNAEFKAQLPDGLHPNEIGHQIISDLVLSEY